jgi:hypothetical protein
MPSGTEGMMKIRILVVASLLASPVWAQSKPVAVRADPCAPIGKTANGQLVYSMKCDKMPVPVAPPVAAAPAPAPAPVVEEEKGGLFRNPFPSLVRSGGDDRDAGVGPSVGGR